VQPIQPTDRRTRVPSSVVRTFSEPDDYAAAIRATNAELTVTGRGDFIAKLIRIDFHRLWMQRFSENVPRILHSAMTPGRALRYVPHTVGPSLFWSGVELRPTNITQHSEGEYSHQLSSSSACFYLLDNVYCSLWL